MKHLLLFIQNHLMQLRRKWFSLPLLLIFPIILVGLATIVIITFFIPEENETIQVGLVDLDQSDETQLVVKLMEESSQLGSYIALKSMTEIEANEAINNDNISSYIIFPNDFTNDLYQGNPVKLPVVGNPNQPSASYMINELIESISRHIRSSQANILTINYYAKQLKMEDEARNDFVFQQFQEFLLYTIGRERILSEREISNQATSSPFQYFAIGSWFIIITIWIFSIYNFLTKENSFRLKNRMRLYGVTDLQQIIAKMLVTLAFSFIFSAIVFYLLKGVFEADIILQDYLRIAAITILYSSLFLICLSLFELIIKSQKIRLLVQSFITFLLLIVSGAIIPVIYYPIWIQNGLPYLFSYEALHWLQKIILNDRLYADFTPLIMMNALGFIVLLVVSLWKERIQP